MIMKTMIIIYIEVEYDDDYNIMMMMMLVVLVTMQRYFIKACPSANTSYSVEMYYIIVSRVAFQRRHGVMKYDDYNMWCFNIRFRIDFHIVLNVYIIIYIQTIIYI